MNTPAIDIQGLVQKYGSTEALHGLSLTVEPGQCYGFFGRNGAGKTTTIKCLLNLLRPAEGSVRVFGLDPRRDESAVKSRLAYVPDFVSFYPWMNVREALDYQASFRKHWNRDLENSLLSQFRLDPAAPTSGLSKGQRTQLALIGAIAAEPELLVLDEPTEGIQPSIVDQIEDVIIGFKTARRFAIVLVEQGLHFAARLADSYVVMAKGAVMAAGKKDELSAEMVKQHLTV